MSSWRPIILLNTMYKSFAKAFQVPTSLSTSISRRFLNSDQIIFLPFRYILDNILLDYDSIWWAKESKQYSMFLKLDLRKACDRVAWGFMFKVMEKIGIPTMFINMFHPLSQNVEVAINFNNQATKPLRQHLGVMWGCLWPLYFHFDSHYPKCSAQGGNLGQLLEKNITLPSTTMQHTINQYANDTLFTIMVEKMYVNNMVRILSDFGTTFYLEIKWTKRVAYICGGRNKHACVVDYQWKWATREHLSKLLDITFGLHLDFKDIDNFFVNMVKNKLTHGSMTYLS